MDRRDFDHVRQYIKAMWKDAVSTDTQVEIWYASLKKYSHDQAVNAIKAYIETSRYEPKPADIIGFIPKGQSKEPFEPRKNHVMINGRKTVVYACQRCQDSGMITWDDEAGRTVGVPCDCPAGHYYFKWGWLTEEEQKAYITEHGYHGEVVGENWYLMQPH